MMSSPNFSGKIDKEQHYGEFLRSARWQDNLSRRLMHKSLDIADNDMNNHIQNGWGWKELLVAGGLALGAFWLSQTMKQQPIPVAAPVESTDTTRSIVIESYTPGE